MLQLEEGGAVLLGPLVPLTVLHPAGGRLGLPPDHDEGGPARRVELQVLPVPLAPRPAVRGVEVVEDLARD